MDTWVWIVLAVAVVVIAGLVYMLMQQRKTGQLSDRFGPEYDRTRDEAGSKRRAEAELQAREKRVEMLHIRPLPADDAQRYATSWRGVQEQFVDDPIDAVNEADDLVAEVMGARGYPVGDFEQRVADISVDHAKVVEHYRAAHDIALRNEQGQASTEDLRQAMVHYRTLFEDLLETEMPTPLEARR